MAYKFQLGDARLSGSVTQEGNITASGSQISASTISLANASGIAGNGLASGSGAGAAGKLEILLQGGAESGLQSEPEGLKIRLSGTANGLQLVSQNGLALKVSSASGLELVDAGIRIAEDGVTNNMLSGNIGFNKLAPLADGKILVGNGSDVATAVSMSGDITISNTGVTTIGTSTVKSSNISGTLAADTINFNGNQFSSSAGELRLKPSISGSLTFEDNITIQGDLIVTGGTFSASVGTLLVEDANIVVADGGSGDTANQGLTIGTSDVVTFQTKQTNNANSLASSVPLSASTYYGDGSNLSGVTADSATGMTIRTYVTGTNGQTQSLSGNAGFYVCSNVDQNTGESSQAVTLHLSGGAGGWSSGDIVVIKAYGNAGAKNLTIYPSGTDQIADVPAGGPLVLESDMAAVSLIYTNEMWFVY